MMLKPKNEIKNACQVNVYLCDQNRSLCSLKGSGLKQRHLSAKSNDKCLLESQGNPPVKTSSLEKLKLNAKQLSALSPSKSLLSSNNLSPWCSLKDLNVISNSNLSINNNYDATSRDCLGSINNLDTVSPRLSCNSLHSLHLDSPDFMYPSDHALESLSNMQAPLMQPPIYPHPPSHHLHPHHQHPHQHPQLYTIDQLKSAVKFCRSTSCPQVVPPMQIKELQISSTKDDKLHFPANKNEPILGKISPAPPENAKTSVEPEGKVVSEGGCGKEAVKEKHKDFSREGERKRRSLMMSKSLARNKCMQWLNSLDEGD